MKTILLVEDNNMLATLYSRFLRDGGFIVENADGGDAALAYLKKHRPDLVLLDILMEPVNGWEVLSRIREKADFRTLPVIVLTARPPFPEIVRHYSESIDGYVMKPVTRTELVAIVNGFFEERTRIEEETARLAREKAAPDLVQEYRKLAGRRRLNESLISVQKMIGIDTDPHIFSELTRYQTLRQKLFA